MTTHLDIESYVLYVVIQITFGYIFHGRYKTYTEWIFDICIVYWLSCTDCVSVLLVVKRQLYNVIGNIVLFSSYLCDLFVRFFFVYFFFCGLFLFLFNFFLYRKQQKWTQNDCYSSIHVYPSCFYVQLTIQEYAKRTLNIFFLVLFYDFVTMFLIDLILYKCSSKTCIL